MVSRLDSKCAETCKSCRSGQELSNEYKYLLTCEIRLRYNRKRASQSLPKISQNLDKQLEKHRPASFFSRGRSPRGEALSLRGARPRGVSARCAAKLSATPSACLFTFSRPDLDRILSVFSRWLRVLARGVSEKSASKQAPARVFSYDPET